MTDAGNTLDEAVARHRDGALEEARALYERFLEQTPGHPDALHLLGLLEHAQGRPAQAVKLVSEALSGNPGNPSFLNSLGSMLLEQNRLEEATAALTAAVHERGDFAEAHYNLARARRASGRLDLAERSFRMALAIEPSTKRAALGLGQTLYDTGRSWDALHFLEQAVQAEPNDPDALSYCGRALADTGNTDLAIEFLRKAIEVAPESRQCRLAAISVLQGIEFNAEHAWYERFLLECLSDAEVNHAAITNVAASLLWVKPAMQDALRADRIDSTLLARLSHEPLLSALLSRTIVRSWAFEEFFTRLRRTLTERLDPDHLPLLACVAEQAFNAGYVQHQSAGEAATEQALLRKGIAALRPVELMALASYRALADAPGAAALADASGVPESMQRVIRKTLQEPLRERELRSQIETLTAIDDEVSIKVQAQYEEHPYPHWVGIQPADNPDERLVEAIARHCLVFDGSRWPQRPRVLVPGCGTGYHPLSLASRHRDAEILAVDLSRTSLAYALRKQQELGVTNIRFCQADVLRLGALTERFEYIDCAGVLHHMESPLAGWRILTELLEPGGVMRIGLYSAQARAKITAAREKISALGIPSTAEGIRSFRQAIMRDAELAQFRSLSGTADFFSMGDVRDLLFHVQERCFDLPAIKATLLDLDLEFGGFLLSNRDVVRAFHERYPARSQWLDLDCWAEFESQHPATFYEMYQFYCLRRPQ